jgi:hypothetical protein
METEKERRDRELIELLTELRVALPGVQVLFAFLLVVPFNQRYTEITAGEQALYFVTLGLAAAASVLLIAPSAQHRLLFRRHFEQRLLPVANRLAIAGFACLALAMIGAVSLVGSFLLGWAGGLAAGLILAVLVAVVWYGIALPHRLDD